MRWRFLLALYLLMFVGCAPAELDHVYDGKGELHALVERQIEARLAAQTKDGGCVVVISGARVEDLYAQGQLPGCADAGPEATVVIEIVEHDKGERRVGIHSPWQISDTWRPDLDEGALERAGFEEARYGHIAAATWLLLDGALGKSEPLPVLVGSTDRPVRAFVADHGPWIGSLIAFCLLLFGALVLFHKIFGDSGAGNLFNRGAASVYIQTGGAASGGGRSRDHGEE